MKKAPAVISSKFQEALGGDEEKYRNCLEWLFDVRTANDLTAAQGSALLDWLLGKGTDKKFDTPIKEPASVEALRIAAQLEIGDDYPKGHIHPDYDQLTKK
jgi:hypothetical protein